MANTLRGVLVGGPKDGTPVEATDKPGARDQGIMRFKSASGTEAVYFRDKQEYPDGIIRFRYLNEEPFDPGPQPDPDVKDQDGEGQVRQKVSVSLNRQTRRWELSVDGEVLADIAEGEIRTREDAEAFRDQHIKLG